MYLKEIIINGFKSFANKTSILLDEGVTCIVGPNGSGKSNVVDAVRFVLGEQSIKSLRGDSLMSDIIFSGSKSRNGLNIASVELIFDNTDNILALPFNSVSVKRKIYTTGENEYYLNNEKCRLKDVINIFLDSNIGKSSFNIISQGDVVKILNGTSLDRRLIFEEASGVLKYKKRKEEAIKKLSRTNDNLIRILDIINELNNQVIPLEEQSKKAHKYLEIKEVLSETEKSLLTTEIKELNTKYSTYKKDFIELNNILLTNTTTYNLSSISISKINNDLIKVEDEYKKTNNQFLTSLNAIEKLSNELVLIKERSKNKLSNNNIFNIKEEILKLNNNISKLTLEIDSLNKTISKLEIYDDEINKLKANNSVLEADKNRLEKSIFLNNNKLELLKNKNININKLKSEQIEGVHDTVNNIMAYPSKYQLSILLALGNNINNIVVDNENVAKEAIIFLKKNGLSRLTFLPINIIKARGIDLDCLNIIKSSIGFISILSDLTTYKEIYRNIILNNLGNIILVDNLDNANIMAKKINYRYKIVTLSNEVLNIGGSITGGIYKNNNLLDKEELDKLIHLEEQLSSNLKEINKKIDNISNQLEEVSQKNLVNKKELFNLENIKELKTNNLKDLYNNLDLLTKERNTYLSIKNNNINELEENTLNQYYQIEKEKNELNNKLSDLLIEKEELNKNKEELEIKEKHKLKDLRELENNLKNLELEVSKVELQLDNNLNILNEEYELTYEKAALKYKEEIDLELAKEKVRDYKLKLKAIGMVNLDAIDEYDKVFERFSFLSKQKEDLIKAKDELLNIINMMDKVMEEEFYKTFKEIDIEFSKVYKDLFKGGEASLKLTDKENILETGIDIFACPPGKKVTSINLLSGGEKTLTAISLLFAILNIKKIPFCLFDEVEAALDDSNVDIFGKYLNHYRNKTQFLIITHKKKTMEYADTLYGVTMQESGVSKLVSVRLEGIK